MQWLLNLWNKGIEYIGRLQNPADTTSEARLLFFIIAMTLATLLLGLEFYTTKKINNTALATYLGAATGGAWSMRS